jgi:hypothetical protein
MVFVRIFGVTGGFNYDTCNRLLWRTIKKTTLKNSMQVIAVNNYYVESGENGIEVPVTDTAGWQPSSGVSDVAHRSVCEQNLLKLRDAKKRNLMLVIMVKLNEASRGNLESVIGMSLENVFKNYMTAFIYPKETPTQQHPIDGGNRMVGCCDATGEEKKYLPTRRRTSPSTESKNG